jgi:serine/alanine adding enzyme
MTLDVIVLQVLNGAVEAEWDRLVTNSSKYGCLYQLAGWQKVVRKSYGHHVYYVMARQRESEPTCGSASIRGESPRGYENTMGRSELVGVLPLVHICQRLFGNSLVSMPYFDLGGIAAADQKVENDLIEKSVELAAALDVERIDLRNGYPLLAAIDDGPSACASNTNGVHLAESGWALARVNVSGKVRMVLDLPDEPDVLMKSFKAKLRSQIRKPSKEGLVVKAGGLDLIDDFYDVFVENMRDLGSPVHSKAFIKQVLLEFREEARVFMVYGRGRPMACSLTVGFRDMLYNPWASALRRYSSLAPNMLLYWSMLEFACERGYRAFDFGRSTVDEGTYRFKEQWGAKPHSLYWYCLTPAGCRSVQPRLEKNRMSRAIEIWKRLPVSVTRVLGPRIRRYISL